MTFSDFVFDQDASLYPADVSDVYKWLYDSVSKKDVSDNAKISLFCVAYTIYCLRKKVDIAEACENTDKTALSTTISDLRARNNFYRTLKDEEIKHIVLRQNDDIKRPFRKYRNDLVANSLIQISINTLKPGVDEINSKGVNDIIKEINLHRKPHLVWWQKLLSFGKHSIYHAWVFICSVLFLYWTTSIIAFAFPSIGAVLKKIFEEATGYFH